RQIEPARVQQASTLFAQQSREDVSRAIGAAGRAAPRGWRDPVEHALAKRAPAEPDFPGASIAGREQQVLLIAEMRRQEGVRCGGGCLEPEPLRMHQQDNQPGWSRVDRGEMLNQPALPR